jgi:hypothetical protein
VKLDFPAHPASVQHRPSLRECETLL